MSLSQQDQYEAIRDSLTLDEANLLLGRLAESLDD